MARVSPRPIARGSPSALCAWRRAVLSPARGSGSALCRRWRSCMEASCFCATTSRVSPQSCMCRIRRPAMPEPLHRTVVGLPASPFSSAALDALRDAAARQSCEDLLESLLGTARTRAFLGTALGDCPFLLDLACKDIARLAAVLEADPRQRLAQQSAEL